MSQISWFWRFAALTVFIISCFLTFSLAFPFQPYRTLEFTGFEDDTVCVNEGVVVQAEREIVTPLFGDLIRAEVSSFWQDTSTGLMEGAGSVPIPIQDEAYGKLVSPIIREAPPLPGEFTLYAETTAYGTLGIVPRHSTIATYSQANVTVEDCGTGARPLEDRVEATPAYGGEDGGSFSNKPTIKPRSVK